ncbi:MAG TPA: carboxypeptidase regulatory-like domain-containing protein [Pyrinomonadaceae bacterium]|nr:carboxypeptidase regulatory-like domain-containing protein [Pyrinomonadaceae bacterium]
MTKSAVLFLLILIALPVSGAMFGRPTSQTLPVVHGAIKSSTGKTSASSNTFNLSSFGAIGDGIADDGPALQSALDAIADAGGGTLSVPAGRYAIYTPVSKNFTGLATSLTISGVGSLTPVPPPTAPGNELSAGLDLVSEFAPRTGELASAVSISGLDTFLIQDIVFIGTPDVENDALISLALADIGSATVRHCEFYGLSSLVQGGAIVLAVRSDFTFEQSVVLGSACSSGVYSSIIQNLEWKGITISDAVFIDYGQRAELYGKMTTAPFSWIDIGNAAAPSNDSPRREVIVRNVFLDEGGFMGLTSVPDLSAPPVYPIDLVQITGLHMNVSNFGTTGHYLDGIERVLIEKSHYGWSHRASSAINLLGIGNAIIDEVECVDSANRIVADSATGKLTVINSLYTHLDSQAQTTDVITTETSDEDPVQHVRQQFMAQLGRPPDAAAHFYWSDRILQCGSNAECVTQRRGELAAYLSGAPSAEFAITGRIVDEAGVGIAGMLVALSGGQSVTTTTDSTGHYHFLNLPTSGVYVITPELDFHTVNPGSTTIVTPSSDQAADFVATFNFHEIAGRVTDVNGNGLAGVSVSLSGSETANFMTGADGIYSFGNLPANGTYTVRPQKTSYAFSPGSRTFSNLDADQTLDFEATFVTYSIGGILVDANGSPLPGLTVTLTGAQSATTQSDNMGTFSFDDLPSDRDYTVTPTLFAHTFNPPSRTFNTLSANQYHNYSTIFTTHTISGRATEASSGTPLSGASVTFSGETNGTTVTDATGNYSLTLPHGGSYVVAIAKPPYTFAQSSFTFSNLSADQTANFAATSTITLSGRVTENGAGVSGISILLSGSQTGTASTDTSGNYSFTVPTGGNYTLTPSQPHYVFSPPVTFNNLTAHQIANFVATRNRATISGRVVNVNNTGVAGIVLSLSGYQTATATTNSNGDYSFANLPAGGDYSVAPTLLYHSFTPVSQAYTNISSDQQNSFSVTLNTHQISGRVTNASDAPVTGVAVALSGSLGPIASTITGADGNYSFNSLPAGSLYAVSVSKPDFVFNPASRTVGPLDSNQTLDFTTQARVIEFSAASYSVAEGTTIVTLTVTRSGDTSEAATVTYSGSNGTGTQGRDVGTVIGQVSFAPGETSRTITIFITDDAFIESAEQLIVSLSSPEGGILGAISSTTLNISDNDSSANPNPVDDAQFFVRQHYRDFLNREPDAAGLAFWSNQIVACGANATCVADRRENVSAAFFLSIEFQETGFLIYRAYKASFAQPPQFLNEFLLDARTTSQGVVVGTPGWQQLLENNKIAFLENFVEQSDFTNQYPLNLTPTEFVNLLNGTAGNPLAAEAIAAAIAEFNGAPTSAGSSARARVLRLTAESSTFTQRELSPAFVLMQYFGYLQRNPSDPPDTSLEGYNFWLTKLNEFGGDFHRAQMVKSFLVSAEYRSRFGL